MTKEEDKLLCESFPNLYRDRHGDMRQTAMCWGFEFGSGWFKIIYDLSEKLEKLILELPPEEREICCASQVKEKYGTLRFYMHGSTNEMEGLIQIAEELSGETCEKCGEPGKTEGGGWVTTLCQIHRDERNGH